MIIENGTLKYLAGTTGGGIGDDGKPVKRTDTWSEAIPCNIRANNRNNLGRKEGTAFIIAAYIVTLERRTGFDPGRIQLFNDEGQLLGEFPVVAIEVLEAVNAIKIFV